MKGIMKMNKRFVAVIAALSIMVSSVTAFAKDTKEYKYSDEYKAYNQIIGYIATYYIDDTLTETDIANRGLSNYLDGDDERLVSLLKSTLSALDPYCEYFTADEYQSFVNNVNKTFYGIGVTIDDGDDYVIVTGFTSDSPANAVGMKVGDKISKVNGFDMKGESYTAVRNAIVGELGTDVSVTVLRDGVEKTFVITRAEVNESTVWYKYLDNGVAYISVSDMSNHTAEEFKEALAKADNDGAKNIILDLRNNGGGYLNCAVEMAELIVPAGTIITAKYRQSVMDKTYKSNLQNPKYNFNVLVNEYTASAAEILSSAIRESGVGKLVGETTYGKGVIQNTFPLSNGSVFKLTVGKYITRNGNDINEVGLKPDEFVVNPKSPIDTTKYTSFTFKKKWFKGDEDDNVLAAKERLYLLNYYEGTPDNKFDDELEESIKKFQEEYDLYAYGVLDITTQTTIENAFADIEVLSDDQLNTAYKMFTGKELDLSNQGKEE